MEYEILDAFSIALLLSVGVVAWKAHSYIWQKSKEHLRFPARLSAKFARWWSKYFVDEWPDDKVERLCQERIDHIKQATSLLETMRAWETNREKARRS